MQTGNGEEVTLPGEGGDPGGEGEGTHCLRIPPLPGHLLQVPGASSIIRGKLLAGCGTQLSARQAEVGAANLGAKQGGSGYPDTGIDLLGGGTVGPALRVRDMVTDTAYAEVVVRFRP